MSKRGQLLTVVLLLCVAAPAIAVIVPYALPDMVDGSEAIVRGEVVKLDSHWLDGPGSIIVTDVSVQIDEVWLGGLRAGRVLTVQVLGGEVGGIGMRSEHAPRFRSGEQAVLFLWTLPGEDRLSVFNDEQGKYTIADGNAIGFHGQAIPLREFRGEIDRAIENSGR